MRTNREIEDRELASWRKANPWTLVNVSSIGTQYGRFPSLAAARKAIVKKGGKYVSTEGNQVLFAAPVYC